MSVSHFLVTACCKMNAECMFCKTTMRYDSIRAHLSVCARLREEPYLREKISFEISAKAKTKQILKKVGTWREEAERNVSNSNGGAATNFNQKETSFSGEKADISVDLSEIGISQNPWGRYTETKDHVDTRGWIYFLIHPTFPGVVKVGHTSNIQKRLRDLRTDFNCVDLDFLRIVEFTMIDAAQSAEKSVKRLLELAGKNIPKETIVAFFNCSVYARGKGEWFRLAHSEVHTFADLFQVKL